MFHTNCRPRPPTKGKWLIFYETQTGRDYWFVKDARPLGRTWEEIDHKWWGGEWEDPNTYDAEGYAVSKTRR